MLWVDPVTSAVRSFSSIKAPFLASAECQSYLNKLEGQFQTV
jgi:hypothetical protein